jgi:hypothetical protein
MKTLCTKDFVSILPPNPKLLCRTKTGLLLLVVTFYVRVLHLFPFGETPILRQK